MASSSVENMAKVLSF